MPSAPSGLCLSVQAAGSVLLVRLADLPVRLDEENARRLRAELLGLTDDSEVRYLLLDLEAVDYLTSTTIEVLLALHRHLKARGGRLVVCNLTPQVDEIFDVLRLGEVLTILTTAPAERCAAC